MSLGKLGSGIPVIGFRLIFGARNANSGLGLSLINKGKLDEATSYKKTRLDSLLPLQSKYNPSGAQVSRFSASNVLKKRPLNKYI
jgi:hypothetical protein